MHRHVDNAMRDRPPVPCGRVADLTMDIMIPDDIKSGLISDSTFGRHETDLETAAMYKTQEETTMTVEQPFHRDSVDIVKVEPDLNAYRATLAEYETGQEECRVKTEPILDVDMAAIGDQAGKSRCTAVKTESKWDTGTIASLGNEQGNVGLVGLHNEEEDAAVECESGLMTFPVRVKLEPAEGAGTGQYESRVPTDVIYPVKVESASDLNAVVKDEPESAADRTNSRLYTVATATAERGAESTPMKNVPVVPNVHLPATALVQCPPPPAMKGLIPVKIVSNTPTTVTNVIDCQGNSTVKKLYPVKFVSNVPGIAERMIENESKSPSQRAAPVNAECQQSVQNLIQVLPNVPAGMTNVAENQVKPHTQTLFPVQILPNLPVKTNTDCQVQMQSEQQRVIPVKIVQNTSAAQTGTVNNQAESSGSNLIPVRAMPDMSAGTAMSYPPVKAVDPLQIGAHTSSAQSVKSQAPSILQRLLPTKTATAMTSIAADSTGMMTSNDILKFPIKMESEPIIGNVFGKEAAVDSKEAVRMVENLFESKEHEYNFYRTRLDMVQDPSGRDNPALSDMANAKKCIFNEFEAKSVYDAYGVAVPGRTAPHPDARIYGNLNQMNVRKGMPTNIVPRLCEPYMEPGPDILLSNVVNEFRSTYNLPMTPFFQVSAMSPFGSSIKPKSSRKPRKEKLECKKDVEFEIIPVCSLDGNGDKRRRDKSQRNSSQGELQIAEMPPEVAAELAEIAEMIKSSAKTAAELVREHGPRVKELWKACSTNIRKPGVKSKTDRRQEFKAWVMSSGEPGMYIMKTMAKSVADYTRKRREKIKRLAEAGDPEAMEVFSRVLENRRRFIERRRALREAGGPAAVAMAQRARDRERKRRAQKALMKAGNCSMVVSDL